MIAIVSSNARERAAFAAVCSSRIWPYVECDSLRAFRRILHEARPKVLLIRHKLIDGYSDDGMAALLASAGLAEACVIVLMDAGAPSAHEARQISLGAGSVMRDPVRTDVLVAYLEKYWSMSAAKRLTALPHVSPNRPFRFAGANVYPLERKIEKAARSTRITPRELDLLRRLFEAQDQVVTYHSLYGEILGRRFRGDSSNLRVLLGKLDVSFRSVRVTLRRFVEVIPKTGYRYRASAGRGSSPISTA